MDAEHSYLTHLECADCGRTWPAGVAQHRCACGGILLARYDLQKRRRHSPKTP